MSRNFRQEKLRNDGGYRVARVRRWRSEGEAERARPRHPRAVFSSFLPCDGTGTRSASHEGQDEIKDRRCRSRDNDPILTEDDRRIVHLSSVSIKRLGSSVPRKPERPVGGSTRQGGVKEQRRDRFPSPIPCSFVLARRAWNLDAFVSIKIPFSHFFATRPVHRRDAEWPVNGHEKKPDLRCITIKCYLVTNRRTVVTRLACKSTG